MELRFKNTVLAGACEPKGQHRLSDKVASPVMPPTLIHHAQNLRAENAKNAPLKVRPRRVGG